jgi:hypothetical protein
MSVGLLVVDDSSMGKERNLGVKASPTCFGSGSVVRQEARRSIE